MADNALLNSMEQLLYKVDALNAIVQQLRIVLTPAQQAAFNKNTIETWRKAEELASDDAKETIQKTKVYAYKYSGIKPE
ncbi:hypothetical protein [Pseudescherichia vulneris]|uniref:hypothetical protein n=1 Tax=Pseudescherichia vulneris TaxID=566 RepID=UPI0028AF60EA|nr:hypothetical protein [Pseudescherichia vulneris]